MATHNDFGKEGEIEAQRFLRQKGYKLLACNWFSGKNEIDIIAETNDFLVIVEVKSRSTDTFEHPKDAITTAKIRRIVEATHDYILQNNIQKDVRFDVISIIPHNGIFTIEHIEDAFLPPVN
ncbi:MAG: YraN family protein [Sphingobacteriia bacterium]|jgi:putative endonuclease|nr:YraN family protein [Paludibacteraceae bacterium]NCA78772.1 YraN family protein [Sphingobacteriia bacterium]